MIATDIKFDDAYFEENILCLYKGTGEESGFIIKLYPHYTELWGIPMYGGEERLEKTFPYCAVHDAVVLALTWT